MSDRRRVGGKKKGPSCEVEGIGDTSPSARFKGDWRGDPGTLKREKVILGVGGSATIPGEKKKTLKRGEKEKNL